MRAPHPFTALLVIWLSIAALALSLRAGDVPFDPKISQALDLGLQRLTPYSSAIQALAALIQLVFTVSLMRANNLIARETRSMSTATSDMVRVSFQQRIDAARPVVIFELHPTATLEDISIDVTNAGHGPLLNLGIHLEDCKVEYQMESSFLPLALPPSESIAIRLVLPTEHALSAHRAAAISETPNNPWIAVTVRATYLDLFNNYYQSGVTVIWKEGQSTLQLQGMYWREPPFTLPSSPKAEQFL